MAKNKSTTVKEADTSDVKYDEIHSKDVDEVVSEASTTVVDEKDRVASTDEPAVEAKSEEKPDEAKKEEDEGVEFDPAKFKQEVSEEIKNTIVSSLQGKSADEKQETMDEYDKFVKETMEKEGRNPTWKEAMLFLKEEIKRDNQKAAEEVKAQEEAKKKQEEEVTTQLNSIIDEELDELYATNKLPKIVDKDDKNDPGVVARQALFQTMLEVNQQRAQEGKPIIYSIHRIFNQYYKPPKVQPAGADAPVSAGRGSETGAEEAVKYEDIHRKSFRELLFGSK